MKLTAAQAFFGVFGLLGLVVVGGCSSSDAASQAAEPPSRPAGPICGGEAGVLYYECRGDVAHYLVVPPVGGFSLNSSPLVVVDVGGPGFDVLGQPDETLDAVQKLWPLAIVALVVEPWQSEEPTDRCRDTVDRYLGSVRDETTGELSMEAVELVACLRPWTSEEYGAAISFIVGHERSSEGEVLLVGLSFGALRLQGAVEHGDVTIDGGYDVLLDSRPEFGDDATTFVDRRARRVEELTDRFAGCDEGCQTWGRRVEQLTADYLAEPVEDRSVAASPADVPAALLTMAQQPELNATFLAQTFGPSIDLGPADRWWIAEASDRYFRRHTGDAFAPSWIGYFSGVCPQFDTWDLDPTDDPLEHLMSTQHEVCRQWTVTASSADLSLGVSNSTGSDSAGTGPGEVCIVDRVLDPSGPGRGAMSGSETFGSPNVAVEHVLYESGHRPLTGIAANGGQDVYSPHEICTRLDQNDS